VARWTHIDGAVVSGRRKAPTGEAHGTVVIAGATAVPASYYEPLADWLVDACGVAVVTFDYRGIGGSRGPSMATHREDLRDWAEDLALVVRSEAARGPVVVVGHSFGGHAFAMTEAHRHAAGLYTFGTGSGWHGWMTRGEARRVQLLWHVLAPPLVAWHGYLPMKRLGMGEDLPAEVYRDWKRWCGYPRYFFDDPEARFVRHFRAVSVPVVGVNSVDDPWAAPASAEAFLSRYPTASLHTVTPEEAGVEAIGHMAYVRPRCVALWEPLAAFVRSCVRPAEAPELLPPSRHIETSGGPNRPYEGGVPHHRSPA